MTKHKFIDISLDDFLEDDFFKDRPYFKERINQLLEQNKYHYKKQDVKPFISNEMIGVFFNYGKSKSRRLGIYTNELTKQQIKRVMNTFLK